METTQILITVPTLNEVFGWLVFYLCIGNLVSLVGCFGLVQHDYGRYAKKASHKSLAKNVFAYTLLWPLAIFLGKIKDYYSYNRCNRDFEYYR